MKLKRVLMEMVSSLRSNKLRTGLTMLGIVIGVAAVISMLSIGQGAQNSISASINSIGTNLLFLSAGTRPTFGGGGGFRNNLNVKSLTMLDAQALMDSYQAPAIGAVAPVLQGEINVSANGQTSSTTVYGVTTPYFSIRNETVSEGAIFNDQQVSTHARVALIGVDVATTLWGQTTGLTGKTILINSQTFSIIGILTSQHAGVRLR